MIHLHSLKSIFNVLTKTRLTQNQISFRMNLFILILVFASSHWALMQTVAGEKTPYGHLNTEKIVIRRVISVSL